MDIVSLYQHNQEVNESSLEVHRKILAHLEAASEYLETHTSTPEVYAINHFIRAERELSNNILEMTLRIDEVYPELSKYVEEMLVNTETTGGITEEALQTYFDALETLFTKYAVHHQHTSNFQL